jgi:hypothetical protein
LTGPFGFGKGLSADAGLQKTKSDTRIKKIFMGLPMAIESVRFN